MQWRSTIDTLETSNAICVDASPEVRSGNRSGNENGEVLYIVNVQGGAVNCPPSAMTKY